MGSLRRVCFVLLTVLAAVSAANAAGWPQFRGPSRDGTSPETGLLKQWPQEGPRELWSVEGLGTGYASVSVADGLVITTGLVGLIQIKPDGYELVSSFRVQKGSKEHWAHPTISDGRLYIRRGEVLMCYDIKAR
jgi:hypothetical protein